MSRPDQATTTTGQRAGRSAPSGFTLVELLVVIMIIAMLAGLVTPAVMRAQATARNAQIKAEIDMLHMAMMNYKNEYGSFPPSAVPLIDMVTGTDWASKHLRKLFPKLSPGMSGTQAACLPYLNSGSGTFAAAPLITPDAALVAWLYGYNDDSRFPVLSTTGAASVIAGVVTVSGTVSPRNKLFSFDRGRVSSTYQYYPPGKPLSPYIYINSSNYTATVGGSLVVQPFVIGSGTYFAHRIPLSSTGDFNTIAQPAFNEDSFQILSAGRDEVFGNDDDLSNFWPGTRKDYLDSLKQ